MSTAAHAVNTPVRKARAEINTGEMPMQSRPDVDVSMDKPLDRVDIVQPVDGVKALSRNYMSQLAFNEEPVTIRISNTSREKNPPKVVDCWVNGKGAEQLINGKWQVTNGWLPIGEVVTTKRMYVEQLMRAKRDQIETKHEEANVESPRNTQSFNTGPAYAITIVRDDNPASADWVTQIMYER